jgi:hypothetical protein
MQKRQEDAARLVEPWELSPIPCRNEHTLFSFCPYACLIYAHLPFVVFKLYQLTQKTVVTTMKMRKYRYWMFVSEVNGVGSTPFIWVNCGKHHITWDLREEMGLDYGYGGQRHFQQYFSYIVTVESFIGGGNRRTPPTCRKSLTNFITCWVHLACAGFEHTTLVVISTDWIGSCKSSYHTITTTTVPR